jgi:hypothetical protein
VINDDDDEQSENKALIPLEQNELPQWDELQKQVRKDYQNLVDQDKENKQFDIWL